jgi:hypothetical protein
MATSPQFPPKMPRRGPQPVPRLQVPKKQRFPWPLLAIIAAAAILAGLIYWIWIPGGRTVRPAPTGADVPVQPTPGQIQLSGFKMTAAPVGNAFYLEGNLFNNGGTEITGVQVQVQFIGRDGEVVGSETRPVGELSQRQDVKSDNLVQKPIKPSESRPVEIYVDHPPANWNKQLPQLTVIEVTGTKA